MDWQLAANAQDRYLRDGLAFPFSILSSDEVIRYRAECDQLEARMGGKPRTIEVRQMHLHFPWAWELARHRAILDVVEGLLGPDLLVWATELFAKHPQDGKVAIAWHRDRPYLGFDGGCSVTAWLALGESTAANGCMRALPRPAEPPGTPAQPKSWTPDPTSAARIVEVALRPGEMSLHDADLLHGSGPNHSEAKRVGFVIRYVTPDARPVQGRPPVLLARGADRHGHFTLVDPPSEAGKEQALAGMRDSAGRHLEVVLANLKHH